MSKTYPMTIVTIKNLFRCLDMNDFRPVGGKPYASEGGKYDDYKFTRDDLRKAFPDLEIKEREAA